MEGPRPFAFQNWKSDSTVLHSFFESVVANYKRYEGSKTLVQVYKSHALYKQATSGDCNTVVPSSGLKSKEGMKWSYWNSWRGTTKETAKRRFITYLAEINPGIIDVVPCEEPPQGFPKTKEGVPICAKCNTTVGCSRILYDKNKFNLKEQLFETEELHRDPVKLVAWAQKALENQRCIWGMHRPIPSFQAKQFETWFSRYENKGFLAYDSDSVLSLIKELVYYHHQLAYDMMRHKDEYEVEEYNEQALKTWKLKDVHKDIIGEEFVFEVQCESDSDACQLRRKADKGANHCHEVDIDRPSKISLHSYEDVLRLRNECEELGIVPSTGVVTSIETRVDLLQAKLDDHKNKATSVEQAKTRLLARPEEHRQARVAISALQGRIGTEKNVRACETGDVTSLLNSVRRGGNPNQEGHRGISVLTCLVLNNAGIDDFEELARLGANMNKLDSRGLTLLIIACVRHEVVLLHCLLKHGALPSGRDSQRRTALHWCALQSHEDGIHTLLKYEEEKSGNGSAFLNMVDSNGDTALSLAAQSRNGLICKVLCTLGADFTKKNREGRSPAMMARERGFSEISEWLDKRMGAGVVKLESSSDVQFERQMRYGAIKVKELIRSFMTVCGRLLGVDMQSTWLVNAAHCRRAAALPLIQQRIFVTALSELLKDGGEGLEELQTIVESILLEVRLGRCCPNVSVSSGSLDWTPLMCAVFIGDCHLIKLLVKQGALVDIGNIHGTTALMLAAALNCVDASFELLSLGADVTCCDLEGFSVHVYSTLLPASKEVAKSVIEAALEGSSTSVRMFTTSDLFRLLKTHSSDDVRELMQANMIEREASLQKTSLTKTLEKHGLTNTSTVVSADLVQQLRVLDSRLGMIAQVRGDISRTMVKNKVGEGRMITVKEGGSSVVRCMLCTLPLPCSHFATAEAMRKREQVDGADEGALMEGVMVTPKKFQSAFAQELIKASRVYERQSERLLLDAEIGDRSIDRNLLMVNEYRDRVHKAAANASKRQVGNGSAKTQDDTKPHKQGIKTQDLKNELVIRAPHVTLLNEGQEEDDDEEEEDVLNDATVNTLTQSLAASTETDASASTVIGTSVSDVELSSDDQLLSHSESLSVPISLPLVLKSSLKIQGVVTTGKPKRKLRFMMDEMTASSISQLSATAVDKSTSSETSTLSLRNLALSSSQNVLRPHPSPISAQGRSVYMFTKDRMNGSAMREGSLALRFFENKEDTYESSAPRATPAVLLSGWLFVNLNDTEMTCPPLKDVFLSFEQWACILSDTIDITNKLLDPFDPALNLDVAGSGTPRVCRVCKVGFVRMKEGIEFPGLRSGELGILCLPCLIRRSLFEKVKLLTADDFQMSVLASWPNISIPDESCATDELTNKVLLGNLLTSLSPIESEDEGDEEDVQTLELDQLSSLPLIKNTETLRNPVAERVKRPSSTSSERLFPLLADASPVKKIPRATSAVGLLTSMPNSQSASCRMPPSVSSPSMQLVSMSSKSPSPPSSYSSPSRSGPQQPSSALSASSQSLRSIDSSSVQSMDSLRSQSPAKRFARPVHSSELSLVPMLLSKGHFHDAESFLRITHYNMHSQGRYDSGVQTEVLALQAEMYRLMGLWPLALALHLDVADLLAMELGHDDAITRAAVCRVMFCLQQMQREDVGRGYITTLTTRLKGGLIARRAEIAGDLLTFYRLENKRLLQLDSLARHVDYLRPIGRNSRTLFYIDGLGGLLNLLTLPAGFPIVCRLSFLAYCHTRVEVRICQLADFCILTLKLRSCQSPALQRTLNQQLIAKFLSKSLAAAGADISRRYAGMDPQSELCRAIRGFSKHGRLFGYEVFIGLLLWAMKQLLPAYKGFLYSPIEGYLWRVNWLDAEAQAYYLNASLIQHAFRRHRQNRSKRYQEFTNKPIKA